MVLTWGDSLLVWGELPFFEKTCSGDLNIAELKLGGSGMMGGLWIMMVVPPTPMETMKGLKIEQNYGQANQSI